MRNLQDKATTTIQLLMNATGAEFEDVELAIEILEENMKHIAKDEFIENENNDFQGVQKW